MDNETVITRNVSIYPEQDAVLIQYAKDSGLGSVSAALRVIITEWQRMKAERLPVQNGQCA